MAEEFDAAIRRRLEIINGMGTGANRGAQQAYSVRQPAMGGSGGPSMRQPAMGGSGSSYNGPRGNAAALRAFGEMIQSLGGRVGENSMFNGGKRITGGHVKNSKHYSDRALDINFGAGTSKKEQQLIDKYLGLADDYGLRSIWRKPGHFNHWHVDY